MKPSSRGPDRTLAVGWSNRIGSKAIMILMNYQVAVSVLFSLSLSAVSLGCLPRLSPSAVSLGCRPRLSPSAVFLGCCYQLVATVASHTHHSPPQCADLVASELV
jgi:hypothetical protein